MLVRVAMVVLIVAGLGLTELPPLLAAGQRRELVVVATLLLLSLAFGLAFMIRPEGPSVAKVLAYWFAPLGEALLGPM